MHSLQSHISTKCSNRTMPFFFLYILHHKEIFQSFYPDIKLNTTVSSWTHEVLISGKQVHQSMYIITVLLYEQLHCLICIACTADLHCTLQWCLTFQVQEFGKATLPVIEKKKKKYTDTGGALADIRGVSVTFVQIHTPINHFHCTNYFRLSQISFC